MLTIKIEITIHPTKDDILTHGIVMGVQKLKIFSTTQANQIMTQTEKIKVLKQTALMVL